jgi:catalase
LGGAESDTRAKRLAPVLPVEGKASRYDNGDEDNFTQARSLYKDVLTSDQRGRLVDNIAMSLKQASEFLQERAIQNFSKVDAEFGKSIKAKIHARGQARQHAAAEI